MEPGLVIVFHCVQRVVTIVLPSSPLHEVVEFSYIVQRVVVDVTAQKSWERVDVGAAAAAMFVLTELQDTLRVPPEKLSIPLQDAITQEIGSLYFDKVVTDLGLCVTLYDITNVEGGSVFPGDGAPHFTVDFRLVMFRPFVGEVLTGKLKRCDKAGLYLSLGGFFEDIHIPEHLLQQPSAFDEEEKLWVWNYSGTPMFMDLEEDVRFRVVQVKYPVIPLEQEKDARPFAPMTVTGDINADGLGLVSWWS